jgi:hypothetical protein
LALARERKPDAITLDICLPDIDGWRVLDRLKNDLATRHIPVYIISTEEERERGLKMGAISVLNKPIKTKEVLDDAFETINEALRRKDRNLLIIDHSEANRRKIGKLIGGSDMNIHAVGTGKEGLALLKQERVHCVVIEPSLIDMTLSSFAQDITNAYGKCELPIILFSTRNLTRKEEMHLKKLAQTTTVKHVLSPERLLDEVSLFMHREVSKMPEDKRDMLTRLHDTDAVLASKKVLIVDDDIRNIFAMTSVLEQQNMQVLSAENGTDAIDLLRKNPSVDVVLMDIMMPDMDGYDTMRAIRKIPTFKSLPIVAVTAKAMKGDREKCIEAGAWDYLSKPVDSVQMLSVLRAWLYR